MESNFAGSVTRFSTRIGGIIPRLSNTKLLYTAEISVRTVTETTKRAYTTALLQWEVRRPLFGTLPACRGDILPRSLDLLRC